MFESGIARDSSKAQVVDGTVHPLTASTLGYLRRLFTFGDTTQVRQGLADTRAGQGGAEEERRGNRAGSGGRPGCRHLGFAVPYSAGVPVLYRAVPCRTVLYRAVPCCTMLYRAVPCWAVLLCLLCCACADVLNC